MRTCLAAAASGPLTIVVVDKTGVALRSSLALKHFPHQRSASAYRYDGGTIDRLRAIPVGSGGFTATYIAISPR